MIIFTTLTSGITSIKKNELPPFNNNDFFVFAVEGASGQIKYLYAPDSEYQSKQKYNTLSLVLEEINADVLTRNFQNFDTVRVFNLDSYIDPETAVKEFMKWVIEVNGEFTDTDLARNLLLTGETEPPSKKQRASNDKPEAQNEEEEEEGEVEEDANEAEDNPKETIDNPAGVAAMDIDTEVQVVNDPFNPASVEDLVALSEYIDPALKYDGFNPKKCREMFIGSKENVEVIKGLLLCLAAYAHIGNNVTKLSVKRMNLEIAKRVNNIVTELRVVKKTNSNDGLTLPRLAIAFMPIYLCYRKYLSSGHQNQTSSNIDVVYKDLCFSGCSTISMMPGYSEYHIDFSKLIKPDPGKKEGETDKWAEDYKRWLAVASNGYTSDVDIHSQMSVIISSNRMTKIQAIEFIDNCINEYKSKITK